jgi:hypothetical protein
MRPAKGRPEDCKSVGHGLLMSKRAAKSTGLVFAGGAGKEQHILWYKRCATLRIDSVEPGSKEQAEGYRGSYRRQIAGCNSAASRSTYIYAARLDQPVT